MNLGKAKVQKNEKRPEKEKSTKEEVPVEIHIVPLEFSMRRQTNLNKEKVDDTGGEISALQTECKRQAREWI